MARQVNPTSATEVGESTKAVGERSFQLQTAEQKEDQRRRQLGPFYTWRQEGRGRSQDRLQVEGDAAPAHLMTMT